MMGEFKMTTIYFIRHAEPNYNNHNDMESELPSKGLINREGVSYVSVASSTHIKISSHLVYYLCDDVIFLHLVGILSDQGKISALKLLCVFEFLQKHFSSVMLFIVKDKNYFTSMI